MDCRERLSAASVWRLYGKKSEAASSSACFRCGHDRPDRGPGRAWDTSAALPTPTRHPATSLPLRYHLVATLPPPSDKHYPSAVDR